MTRERLIDGLVVEKLRRNSYENTYGCWIWLGGTSSRGYGVAWCSHRDKSVQAHRLAWESVHGEIPSGQVARHLCDNPLCVNPAHIDIGTQRQNMADIRRTSARCDAYGNRLPVGVYVKHGAYHLVRNGRWRRLGKHYDSAMERLKMLDSLLDAR